MSKIILFTLVIFIITIPGTLETARNSVLIPHDWYFRIAPITMVITAFLTILIAILFHYSLWIALAQAVIVGIINAVTGHFAGTLHRK